ncbi:alpha/beta hydrolase [Caulobacter henricii]|uniref:Dienelactone hydrolase n=1 Tax=Caulobacter henricii TaxID=69395 RepID=A0A0P0NYT3_9CAUL|nr:alpha/beta hydrolase [Caulobacter henricii]ALL12913.1 dienelactone hydrolase [Caulobacter henricii]
MFHRRGALATVAVSLLALGLGPGARAEAVPMADPAETIELWPAGPPGAEAVTAVETVLERGDPKGLRDRALTHIRKPALAVFRPKTPNGAAVMLIPGGGYERVVMDKEGYETARWLADRGYTCFVLFYRLPGDGWSAGPDVPLQDAQRGLRLVRSRAAALGFSANRIAIMGFSAGGHVAASLTTRFSARVYDRIDAVDDLSARPDLSALIYPVITMAAPSVHAGSRKQLLGANPTPEQIQLYSPDRQVGADAPPVFLLHAVDDKSVPVENTLLMFASLKARSIPTEMHVFNEGGHGFGLRFIAGKPVAAWPDLFTGFARQHGL